MEIVCALKTELFCFEKSSPTFRKLYTSTPQPRDTAKTWAEGSSRVSSLSGTYGHLWM